MTEANCLRDQYFKYSIAGEKSNLREYVVVYRFNPQGTMLMGIWLWVRIWLTTGAWAWPWRPTTPGGGPTGTSGSPPYPLMTCSSSSWGTRCPGAPATLTSTQHTRSSMTSTRRRGQLSSIQVLERKYITFRFRVLGPLSNNPEFAAAFSCPIDTPMNPQDKCRIW